MSEAPKKSSPVAHARMVIEDLKRCGYAVNDDLSDDQLYRLGDRLRYSDVECWQDLRWVRDTLEFAEVVAAGSPTRAERLLFWIRLGGLLIDIAAHHRKSIRDCENRVGDTSGSPVLAAIGRFVESLDAVEASLSEDELYYLEYRRDSACHPRQSMYRARLAKDSTLKSIRPRLVGRLLTHAESDEMLSRVIARHPGDEPAIATEIAARILSALREVETAATAIFTPNEALSP